MGSDRIDGTIEAVWLKRRRDKLAVYDKIQFRLASGGERVIGKSIVAPAVADRLVPGTSGRFYLYSAIDHKGVSGVRDAAGGAVFGFPTVNETAMLVVGALNIVWLGLAVSLAGVVPILPLILTVCSIPLYFLYRGTRLEARRRFDADGGFAPPAP
jgi:hypothetical protein